MASLAHPWLGIRRLADTPPASGDGDRRENLVLGAQDATISGIKQDLGGRLRQKISPRPPSGKHVSIEAKLTLSGCDCSSLGDPISFGLHVSFAGAY